MSDFTIGLSGLNAAQKALDVIGNNIANAATEGYHRQRINLSPIPLSLQGSVLLGGGVDVKGITRIIDNLLEQEILRQQSALEHVSQEFSTLRTIENAFGELSTEDGGLNAAIDKFFNALQDLSAHPAETIWQNQIVSNAEAMAGQFRALGEFLDTLETQIRLKVENTVDSINILTSQIAELNSKIAEIELLGSNANTISDQRDQCISELSELISIQTLSKEYGVVNVSAGETPLVTGVFANELEVGLDKNGNLGVSITGTSNYATDIQGGKIGGLLSLKNEIVPDIDDDLDSLASAIIQQINQYHVQGVGSEGSFTNLTGWTNASGDLSDFSDITDGKMYIRVTYTNPTTSVKTVTRHEISVDKSADSLSNIATAITTITGLTASVNASKQLTILANTGYKYDFLPAVLPKPETADIDFNGTSDPTVTASGVYTGSLNNTLKFTVSATGNVGVTDSLMLTVKNLAENTIATINIGVGYAAGEIITVGNTGIKIALSTGDLADGDSFSIDVFADTDTSGVLSAVGINTFFAGSSATNIAVRSDISANPKRVATALGVEADMIDNENASRMADVKDEVISSLGSQTCGEFYRRMVTDIGQQFSAKQMRQDNTDVMLLNLTNRRNDISSVDINEEAAQLLVFEQMFQAMAKYINTINSTISSLMELM